MKMGRFNGWVCGTLVLFSLLTMAGCTLFSPVDDVTTKGVLNQTPSALPHGSTSQATLLVLPPEATPLFNTPLMAYTAHPNQINYFSRYEWATPPAQMLLPLLVKTLENTHHFNAVVRPPFSGHYDYLLRTEITEIIQDFTTDNATMKLSLRVQLSDATGRIIATHTIDQHTAMQQKNPSAGIDAANQATALALEEVARFVVDASQ